MPFTSIRLSAAALVVIVIAIIVVAVIVARASGDTLLFDQFEEVWAADESLAARAQNNDFANFRLVFDRTFLDTVVRRMDENEDIFKRILDEADFRQTVLDHYAERLYARLRGTNQLRLADS